MNAAPLFSFGSLRDPDVLACVLGRPIDSIRQRPAWRNGFRAARVPDETYPVMLACPGERIDGVILEGLDDNDWKRILFFESDEYEAAECTVHTAAGAVKVCYFSDAQMLPGAAKAWHLDWWQMNHKDAFMNMIRAYMGLYGKASMEEAERLWESMSER